MISDYIKFCVSSTIPTKTIKKYPNSKPWITAHLRHSFSEKQKAFQRRDWAALKIIDAQIKKDILEAKLKYKNDMEQEFRNMNTKEAFNKVKILTGGETKQKNCTTPDPLNFANTLNTFL